MPGDSILRGNVMPLRGAPNVAPAFAGRLAGPNLRGPLYDARRQYPGGPLPRAVNHAGTGYYPSIEIFPGDRSPIANSPTVQLNPAGGPSTATLGGQAQTPGIGELNPYGVPNALGTAYNSLPGESWLGGGFSHIDQSTGKPVYDPLGTINSPRSPLEIALARYNATGGGGGGGRNAEYSNPAGPGNMGFATGGGGWITHFQQMRQH